MWTTDAAQAAYAEALTINRKDLDRGMEILVDGVRSSR